MTLPRYLKTLCLGLIFWLTLSPMTSIARPAGCPDDLVCFTTEAAALIATEQEKAEQEVDDLTLKVAKLELKIAKHKARKVWAQVGMEYLPNVEDQYEPYAIGGVNLGPVTLWGGAFGGEPVLGIGWRF